MTSNKNQHIRIHCNMKKAPFLLQSSVVYSVYGVQLKLNILSQLFNCSPPQFHLIQKNWLCLSFELPCVRFFPLIFGFFFSFLLFLFIFSVERFPFSFENDVQDSMVWLNSFAVAHLYSQYNTVLYISLCVLMYMTRRVYKRLCRCGAEHNAFHSILLYPYSQPTSLRMYICIHGQCTKARRNRETCCYVNSWIIFQWEKCIWWNKNEVGWMCYVFAFRAIMLTVNESKRDGNTCRAKNAFWIRIWNSDAFI